MSQDVKPTRTELMRTKSQIKLAKKGHGLLKKKRDGLILEFFEVMKRAKELRAELTSTYKEADHRIRIARALDGDMAIESAAKAVNANPNITVTHKNIVGVVVPRIEASSVIKKPLERGYGIFTSAAIDEAAAAYEKLGEAILKVAEIETSMRRLLNEIEKTKRKVNALEFNVIPTLEKQQQLISFRLQEMERDNFVRLKLIKARLAD
ncbi:MAG TPA: V-type ATP synthase subunit D [Candidatus Nanoarchaeia archaeon]|nr:V-type ATP synthase subunit D [Candidatus Nanoarchaeia archaeon]